MLDLYSTAAKLLGDATPFVIVTLLKTIGSAPQEVGAKMLVTSAGRIEGTVGGGKLEAKAEQFALELLKGGSELPHTVDWNLQTDVKMTCGGVVTLLFEPQAVDPFRVAIFGAGHVAQAVVRVLIVSPNCHVICIDPRKDWLNKLPDAPLLRQIHADSWEALPGFVPTLRDGDYVLCMTQGHSCDRPVLERIFKDERKFPYLGVIGSSAKRKKIVRELVEAGIGEAEASRFFCPIGDLDEEGNPIGTSEPAHIAWTVASQLLRIRYAKKPALPAA